jgi:hypothetical protein
VTEPNRPSPRRRALLAAVAVPAALAALPAALSAAPVIATDAICLRPGQEANGTLVSPPLTITGSGFTPGSIVQIIRGATSLSTIAGADGTFVYQASVIDLVSDRLPRSRPLDIVATDATQGPSNTLRIRTAALALSATPRQTRPSNTVTYKLSGFVPDKPVFAHYRFNGRLRATVRMGLASNPCGLLTARRDQIPVKDPAVGLWRIQFSQSRTFKAKSVLRIEATVTVFRTAT